MSGNNDLIFLGGTGGLDQEMAKGLRTSDGFTNYRALVRDVKSEKAKALVEIGWALTAVDDMLDDAKLKEGLKNAKVIVSTYGGDNLADLETAAIKAAKSVGASLYVPSQFGEDYRRFGTEFPFVAEKAQVLKVAEEIGLPTLSVFVGLFSDFIFGFLADLEKSEAPMIGDKDGGVSSYTRRSDIGFVLAKALEDPTYLKGGTLSMQSATMTWKEAVEKLGKATGKPFTFVPMTLEEAASTEKALLEKGLAGDMGSLFGALKFHLLNKPAGGNTGSDTSAEAVTMGVELEPFETTLANVFGGTQ